MSEKKVFVFCDDDCKGEGMTKEQILTAIEQAINTGQISNVDAGFITKIKEQNKGGALSVWIGSEAEYNALPNIQEGCLYLITDDTTYSNLINIAMEAMQKAETAEYLANEAAAAYNSFNKTLVSGEYVTAGQSLSNMGEMSNYKLFAFKMQIDGASEYGVVMMYANVVQNKNTLDTEYIFKDTVGAWSLEAVYNTYDYKFTVREAKYNNYNAAVNEIIGVM